MNKNDKKSYINNIPMAKYFSQELLDFKDNPMIEALPSILSPEEAYDKLCLFPKYNDQERFLPVHLRYHAIPRIERFFQPVMKHLDLEQRFSRLLRYGYVGRNPFSSDFTKQLDVTHKILSGNKVERNFKTTASSFTLIGFSGIGKTTAIESILSLYPQVLLHKAPLNIIQIVWLKLNCPHDGSIKTLCMNFFQKIDELIGSNYFQKFGNSRNSISSMVIRMGQVARIHCIGALIIDEIQHLLTTKDNGSEKMMNFFVTLMNEVGIPMVMIGTMRAKSILQQDFRQARHSNGYGSMIWENMKPGDDWDLIIESMWKYQWTKKKVP